MDITNHIGQSWLRRRYMYAISSLPRYPTPGNQSWWTAKQTGLLINPQKTKTMRINTTQTDKLTIRDTEVEHVEQFTYLGSIISITGGTDEDIKVRKRKAQQAFAMLKPVWRSTTLRTSTKLRLFNSNVTSVLLYGSETWR